MALDDGDLEQIPTGVRHQPAVFDRRGFGRLARQNLIRDEIDHPQPPPGCGHAEIQALKTDIHGGRSRQRGRDSDSVNQPASPGNELTANIDIFDPQAGWIRKHHQVGLAARGDGPQMGEAEAFGRVEGGHPDGGYAINAPADRGGDDGIDVAVFEQVVGMAVVRAPHEPARVALGDDGQQRGQVAGTGALADHDVHAGRELFQGLGRRNAFVVAADPGRDIRRQILSGKAGGVTVDRPAVPVGGVDFSQNLRIAVQHPRIVHHFAQGDDARVLKEGLQIGGRQPRAGCLHVGGRHAGGQGVENIDRLAGRGGQHVSDPFGAEHVGDFMRVGHHRRGAAGHHRSGEFGDAGHGTFDVHMGVDETGCDEAPAQIDGRAGGIVADADDPPGGDGHAAGGDLPRENIDDARVGQKQVAGLFTACGFPEITGLHGRSPKPAEGVP